MLQRKPLKRERYLPAQRVKKAFPYNSCRYIIRNLFLHQANGYRPFTHSRKESRSCL